MALSSIPLFTGISKDSTSVMSTSAADPTPERQGRALPSRDDQEVYELLDRDGITDDIHLFNEKLKGGRIIQLDPPTARGLGVLSPVQNGSWQR